MNFLIFGPLKNFVLHSGPPKEEFLGLPLAMMHTLTQLGQGYARPWHKTYFYFCFLKMGAP